MQDSKIRRNRLTLSVPLPAPTAHGPSTGGTLNTETLFNGGRELKILHNSEIYRLTITKLGKLILTK